jgi:predicted methyltransferase
MKKLVAGLMVSLVAACASAPPAVTRDQAVAIVASPDRTAADRKTDERRKPVDMLAFIGVRPGMTALDISASGGYTT